MFYNKFLKKKVLVTGHTGFKGAWLSAWLLKLGAEVVGISNNIPTEPSLFKELNLENKVKDFREDIRNLESVKEIVISEKPDFIFHMAAQPIVSLSYLNPIETLSTNIIGTANILEAARFLKNECACIIITSDKCYDNLEWVWGYKENDILGGKDIYSGSKGGAELVFNSYYHSFFKKHEFVRIASARAGNVIGGGDWADDRIVPDCMRAWNQRKVVEIRSPNATRPWQHVLEPLSGYLDLAYELSQNESINGESFNFGPKSEHNYTVKTLLEDLSKYWNFKSISEAYSITDNILFHEAGLLKLNCDKSLFFLKWKPTLEYNDLIQMTGSWYFDYYNNDKSDVWNNTLNQISHYENLAIKKQLKWTL